MAIEKKNNYTPGVNNDLTSAVANIDLNRVGTDLTVVEYSAPNFLIKVGSIIEANGNIYVVTGTDETVTAADGNLIFNESTGFAIDNVNTPTLDPAKGGYYVNSGTERVTKYEMFATGDFKTISERIHGTAPENDFFKRLFTDTVPKEKIEYNLGTSADATQIIPAGMYYVFIRLYQPTSSSVDLLLELFDSISVAWRAIGRGSDANSKTFPIAISDGVNLRLRQPIGTSSNTLVDIFRLV